MGPRNGVVGDSGFDINDIPQTQVPEEDLTREKAMAKFANSKEFKELKEYLNSRISFYQSVLPDGRALTAVDTAERKEMWITANVIIAEFKNVLGMYEQAQEAIKDARRAGA